jgi:hypothetical protein
MNMIDEIYLELKKQKQIIVRGGFVLLIAIAVVASVALSSF